MLSPFEWMIAKRYLWPGKGEAFIALVAAISVGVVSLSVALLVVVMSVMNGFRGELLDKMADYLNAVPSTPRQLASACAVSLEEAAAAVRLLHRRGRIRRHVDETQPSTGIARRWHNVSWIGRDLAERQREALRQAEHAAIDNPDRTAEAIADIVRAMPRLHAIANNPSPCR